MIILSNFLSPTLKILNSPATHLHTGFHAHPQSSRQSRHRSSLSKLCNFSPTHFSIDRSHLVGLNGTLSARAFDTRVPRSFSISPERHRDRNVSLYSSRCISTTPGQIGTLNYCEGDFKAEQMIQSKITTVVLAIFFVSLLGVGMGQTAVYTLGIDPLHR